MSTAQVMNPADVQSYIAGQTPRARGNAGGGDNPLQSDMYFGPMALSIASMMAYLESSVKLAVLWGETYSKQAEAFFAFTQASGQAQINMQNATAAGDRASGIGALAGAGLTGLTAGVSLGAASVFNSQVSSSTAEIESGNAYMSKIDEGALPDRVVGPADIADLPSEKQPAITAKIKEMTSSGMKSSSLVNLKGEEAVGYMNEAQAAKAKENIKSNIEMQTNKKSQAQSTAQTYLQWGQTLAQGLSGAATGGAGLAKAGYDAQQGEAQNDGTLNQGAATEAQGVMSNASQQNGAAIGNIQAFASLMQGAIQASSYRA